MNHLTALTILAIAALSPAVAFADADSTLLSLSDRLEQAIYLQEAQADYDAAMKVYQEILSTTQLAAELAAEAHYRMATCYLEMGNDHQASIEYSKIVAAYPSGSEWVEAAKARLPQEFEPSITPWSDGERCLYEWYLPNGSLLGRSAMTVRRVESEGRDLWRVESRYILNGQRMLAVEFDPETFATVYSAMHGAPEGPTRCWFGEGSARVEYPGKEEPREFPLSGQVYENEQAWQLMRQMSVEKGFRTTLSVFVPLSGVAIPVTFEVVDRLEMDTAIGKLDCSKLELSVPGPKQTFYISADERRLPVKLEVGGVEARLIGVSKVQYGEWTEYAHPEFGFAFEMPEEWVALPDRNKQDDGASNTVIMDVFAQGGYTLYSGMVSQLSEAEVGNVEEIARRSVQYFNEHNRGGDLEIDESQWTVSEANGLKTVSFVGDYVEGSGTATRYRSFVSLGRDRTFVFTAYIPANRYEEDVATFERMARSLRE